MLEAELVGYLFPDYLLKLLSFVGITNLEPVD
jgi:hypothetical protein